MTTRVVSLLKEMFRKAPATNKTRARTEPRTLWGNLNLTEEEIMSQIRETEMEKERKKQEKAAKKTKHGKS